MSTRVKGSHDYRIRILEEVEPEIKDITTKEEAAKVIQDNYRKTNQMEFGGMNRIKEQCLEAYLKLYEIAAQLALNFHIYPEIAIGYAYRLRLLGMYSSGFRLTDAIEVDEGLFNKEMMSR